MKNIYKLVLLSLTLVLLFGCVNKMKMAPVEEPEVTEEPEEETDEILDKETETNETEDEPLYGRGAGGGAPLTETRGDCSPVCRIYGGFGSAQEVCYDEDTQDCVSDPNNPGYSTVISEGWKSCKHYGGLGGKPYYQWYDPVTRKCVSDPDHLGYYIIVRK